MHFLSQSRLQFVTDKTCLERINMIKQKILFSFEDPAKGQEKVKGLV